MKKLVLALIVALTLAPFSAFGLEMMTDDSLKDTTAQAGVVIALDDVSIVQHSKMDTMYIDDDGMSANTGVAGDDVAAALYIKDMGTSKRTIKINAIYTGSSNLHSNATLASMGLDAQGENGELDQWGLVAHKYSYGTEDGFIVQQALTIDIGRCPILSAGMQALKTGNGNRVDGLIAMLGANAWTTAGYDLGTYLHMEQADQADDTLVDVVGINITLPSVEIHQKYEKHCKVIGVAVVEADVDPATGDVSYNKVYRTGDAATYMNSKEVDNLISIQKEGESTIAILSGKLEIAPK